MENRLYQNSGWELVIGPFIYGIYLHGVLLSGKMIKLQNLHGRFNSWREDKIFDVDWLCRCAHEWPNYQTQWLHLHCKIRRLKSLVLLAATLVSSWLNFLCANIGYIWNSNKRKKKKVLEAYEIFIMYGGYKRLCRLKLVLNFTWGYGYVTCSVKSNCTSPSIMFRVQFDKTNLIKGWSFWFEITLKLIRLIN